jgi:hypothetical protein
MAKLAYYASPVPDKETWFETAEGYRIYKDVPICRTGSQFYYGRELKKNAGYDSIWDLKDDQQYEVFRPVEEVTAPATLASFEGKSVLDEHPSDKVLIDALDEYDGVSQGHIQNIRVGNPLPDGEFAGETPLLADVHVKNPELNEKIEIGIREVSCGYRFLLAMVNGRLTMTKIRGNHLAVVPKGRAGPEIAIGDAAPGVSPKSNETRKAPMSFSSRVMRAIGFQSWAKDAKPEEVADALEEIEKESAEGSKDADEHVNGCRCEDCMPDKSAKDKRGGKDSKGAKDAAEEEEAKKKAAADKAAKDAKEEEEKAAADKAAKDAKEAEEKAAKDEAEILAPEDRSKSEFSVGDAIASLESDPIRKAIARSKDPVAIKSYNSLTENLRKVRDGVKDGAIEDPFVSLVDIGSGVVDAEPEPSMMSFFNGRSYQDGLKLYNEYLASKGAK